MVNLRRHADRDQAPLRLLSLGAGVQSSTLALMAATGALPPIDGAIFADTQAEPSSVYVWLDWLEAEIARSPSPFPVYRVTRGSLAADALVMRTTKDGRKFCNTSVPYFTRSADGALGRIVHRSCTADYKIKPIIRKARELARPRRGSDEIRMRQLIGISIDEASRMKPARDRWIQNEWPLIDLGMNRRDCLAWMEAHGYPKHPRSACYFCPFHNAGEWRRLRDHEPEAFAAAVAFERAVQSAKARTDNFDSTPFLHRSCVPLDQVDLSTAEERGQLNFFENECEGMCGV